MFDATDPHYDDHISLIKRQVRNGKTFDELRKSGFDEAYLEQFVKLGVVNVLVTPGQWGILIDHVEEQHKRKQAEIRPTDDVTVGDEISADVRLSEVEESSWQLYRTHLLREGWYEPSVDQLGLNAVNSLKRMSRDTSEHHDGAVKGLVVGHVQSGKTANIASLMAAGADNGWNFFIILSGTIESLRRQTSNRLFTDLNHPGNLQWLQLSQLGTNTEPNHSLQNMLLQKGNPTRYFTVSLKVKSRLENLLSWLKSDKNKLKQMRLVIIDDEADQASINTSASDRTRINKLIIELTQVPAQAANYVAYTATPYSCFLNEAFPESLYPRNFIKLLPQSFEHFGPKQIFGYDDYGEGIDIIRTIPKNTPSEANDDFKIITKKIHTGISSDIPSSLKNALAWFICCCAVRRSQGVIKPVTMLVHTSQKQIHHQNMANAISKWFVDITEQEILELCKAVYDFERDRFSLEDLNAQFPDYRLLEQVQDYPDFSLIEDEIPKIIHEVTHINIEGENDIVSFSKGINLCIDNSSNTGINDNNEHIRLLYPNNEHPTDHPTAFIVIGGNTLSRGLTLEGLICTYFLRNVCQADTLMQMGRWFGYRRGYELLPRIWMTDDTQEKFSFLTSLEEELRADLKSFNEDRLSPKDLGPRVKNSIRSSWLRPTGKNKMQNAIPYDVNYSGFNTQTTLFLKNAINNNLIETEKFIMQLGDSRPSFDGSSIFYEQVPFRLVKHYLIQMQFHPDTLVFSDLDPFFKWYESVEQEAGYTNWNVVIGSIKKKEDKDNWEIVGVPPVRRSIIVRPADKELYTKVMRAPKDLLADVKLDSPIRGTQFKNVVKTIREGNGLGGTPQMIIYNITGEVLNENREKTGKSVKNLIGISLWIPSIGGNDNSETFVKSLTVRIPQSVDYSEDE
nr:Z1 domain-containing protein [uncultured Sphaerochaeta sp.]